MNTKYIELVSAYLKPQYCLQSIVLRIVLDTLLDLYMMVYLEDVGGGGTWYSLGLDHLIGVRNGAWTASRLFKEVDWVAAGRINDADR